MNDDGWVNVCHIHGMPHYPDISSPSLLQSFAGGFGGLLAVVAVCTIHVKGFLELDSAYLFSFVVMYSTF